MAGAAAARGLSTRPLGGAGWVVFGKLAKLRREAGQSVEEVSRFLGHSSLAVTSVYLRRLAGPGGSGLGEGGRGARGVR